MKSKRSQEGYLLIDHRASVGLTEEQAKESGGIPVRGGGMFESACFTCSHCQAAVILNPNRSRSRGYCHKCDHYICDTCEVIRVQTGACRTFKQFMDEFCEKVSRSTF